jgi:hypothetical protein
VHDASPSSHKLQIPGIKRATVSSKILVVDAAL